MRAGSRSPEQLAEGERISIIVPTLNEGTEIESALDELQGLRRDGHELIVVDGGSVDGTVRLATSLCDQVLQAPRGRGHQLEAGARNARGDIMLFLHVDTRLPPDAARQILWGLGRGGFEWGRFDVRLSGRHWLFRIIERAMNLRSRVTGVATGDQGIFVRREALAAAGGVPRLALMEDIALSRGLKAQSRPLCLHCLVTTSTRRWERQGIVRTVLRMWWLRLAYFLGVDPRRLVRVYERA